MYYSTIFKFRMYKNLTFYTYLLHNFDNVLVAFVSIVVRLFFVLYCTFFNTLSKYDGLRLSSLSLLNYFFLNQFDVFFALNPSLFCVTDFCYCYELTLVSALLISYATSLNGRPNGFISIQFHQNCYKKIWYWKKNK